MPLITQGHFFLIKHKQTKFSFLGNNYLHGQIRASCTTVALNFYCIKYYCCVKTSTGFNFSQNYKQ